MTILFPIAAKMQNMIQYPINSQFQMFIFLTKCSFKYVIFPKAGPTYGVMQQGSGGLNILKV